jgi:hypothetical protein
MLTITQIKTKLSIAEWNKYQTQQIKTREGNVAQNTSRSSTKKDYIQVCFLCERESWYLLACDWFCSNKNGYE